MYLVEIEVYHLSMKYDFSFLKKSVFDHLKKEPISLKITKIIYELVHN